VIRGRDDDFGPASGRDARSGRDDADIVRFVGRGVGEESCGFFYFNVAVLGNIIPSDRRGGVVASVERNGEILVSRVFVGSSVERNRRESPLEGLAEDSAIGLRAIDSIGIAATDVNSPGGRLGRSVVDLSISEPCFAVVAGDTNVVADGVVDRVPEY
jgi:hypothetical protein